MWGARHCLKMPPSNCSNSDLFISSAAPRGSLTQNGFRQGCAGDHGVAAKIRLFPRISKDIRDLTFVESLSRLGRPQTSLGLLSLLGDFYPFVSVSCFWGVWHISSLLPQSITEMAVVGVTTAIRHLLAEAGGGESTGFPHAPDFREMIISSRSGR